MKTIAIPQFYCGPSGQKGLYNRQEVGLARAFAALGCRAVVLYPAPGAAAPTVENPEPNVKIYYLPVRKLGAQAFFSSWQVLLDEQVDAVHVMGDNSPGVPSLYRFCRKHGILFYSQLGALKSTSDNAVVRRVMDLLLGRNLAVYRKTPTYAKTPAVAAELESLGVPCAGLMPVGLDTAIKYASQGAGVYMTLTQAERKAVLTVENGGPPIPPEVLPHLFDRFYRADGSRTQGGFGLGLSIAQTAARAMGGTLAAANRPEGGAAFTLTLPRTDAHEAKES